MMIKNRKKTRKTIRRLNKTLPIVKYNMRDIPEHIKYPGKTHEILHCCIKATEY